MKTYLVIGIMLAGIAMACALDRQQKIDEMHRLQAIEYRMDNLSSELWKMMTRLEYPDFPPTVCIKRTSKISMKHLTKGKIND